METLILLSLAAAVLFTAMSSLLPSRAQPPQIIVMQVPPAERPGSTGCLPLIILVAAVLAALTLL